MIRKGISRNGTRFSHIEFFDFITFLYLQSKKPFASDCGIFAFVCLILTIYCFQKSNGVSIQTSNVSNFMNYEEL